MASRFAVCAIFIAALSGCDSVVDRPFELDAAWHKRALVEGHLAHWLTVAPSASGFLHSSATRTWRRKEQKSVDIVAQSRQVYVLLSGYELTGNPQYLDGARAGADFMLRHFRDPVHGGFFRVVATDGNARDVAKSAYGNAFAIFALAHAYRVTRDDRYREAAFAARRAVTHGLRDPAGGVRASGSLDFTTIEARRVLDVQAHLLEAMLALHEATGSAEALAAVRETGDFLLYRILQGRPDGSAFFPGGIQQRMGTAAPRVAAASSTSAISSTSRICSMSPGHAGSRPSIPPRRSGSSITC